MKRKKATRRRKTSPKRKVAAPRQVKVRLSRQARELLKQQQKAAALAERRARAALKLYESAAKMLQRERFGKARRMFEALIRDFPDQRDLAERARVHINICNAQLSQPTLKLKTADDHYNYAVSLLNSRNFEEAKEHFTKALKKAPNADYIHYGLATLHALEGDVDSGIKHLEKAIHLKESNRYLARSDDDLENLRNDPRFQTLVHPESVHPPAA